MNPLIALVTQHPIQSTLAGKALWDAFVGAFAAPSANSGPVYRFFFTFLNLAAFNFQRAKSTAIENSPNFEAAAEKWLAARQQQPSPTETKA